MMSELSDLKKKSRELRAEEMFRNFNVLSEENQIRLVMLSRKAVEQEKEDRRTERFLHLFRMLDDKSKTEFVEYLEALTKDPRYRKLDE